MPKRCVAGGCSNSCGDGFRMQVWPKDPIIAEKWTKFVKRTRKNWSGPTPYSLLCSAHFEEGCYFTTPMLEMCGYPARRVKDAIPTIYKRLETKPCDRGRRYDVQWYNVEKQNHPQKQRFFVSNKSNQVCDTKHVKNVNQEKPLKLTIKKYPNPMLLDHNYAVVDHKDDVETTYFISDEEPLTVLPKENSNTTQDNKDQCNIRKRKFRKKKALSMYGGKSKLQRNLNKHCVTQSRQVEDKPINILKPTQAKLDLKENIRIRNIKRKMKKKRSILMYSGKTKLQRNLFRPSTVPKVKTEIKHEVLDTKEKNNFNWIITEPETENLKPNFEEKPDEIDEGVADTYQNDLLESLYSMQKNGKLCDLTFKVNSSKTRRQVLVKVHRLIFSAISKKIKLHRNEIFEIEDDEVNMQNVAKVIEFAYTGRIKDIEEMKIDELELIRKAADLLDITKCMEYVVKFYPKEDKRNGEITLDEEMLNSEERENIFNFKPPNDEYPPISPAQTESDVESTRSIHDSDTTDTDDDTPIKPKTFTTSRSPFFPSKLQRNPCPDTDYIVID